MALQAGRVGKGCTAAPRRPAPRHSLPVPQEEALLAALISAVISLLVLMLAPANASDYVYAALFLTCTSAVLKLRWLVGTVALAVPVLVAAATNLRLVWPDSDGGACLGGGADVGVCAVAAVPLGGVRFESVGALAPEAVVHLLVAWAVGALMAFVSGAWAVLRAAAAAAVPLQAGAAATAAVWARWVPSPCCCLFSRPALPWVQTATGAPRLRTTSWR